jgi:hypothetical protein
MGCGNCAAKRRIHRLAASAVHSDNQARCDAEMIQQYENLATWWTNIAGRPSMSVTSPN